MSHTIAFSEKVQELNMATAVPAQIFDVAIIGGGPAGITCAIWLQLLGIKTMLLEKASCLGGQQCLSPYENVWLPIANGLTGKELAHNMQSAIQRHGVASFTDITALHIEPKNNSDYYGVVAKNNSGFASIFVKKLVLATGVKNKTGGMLASDRIIIGSGDQLQSEYFSNKHVAILGGGDNAIENFGFIQAFKPASTHIFARTLRARQSLLAQVPKKNISVGSYEVDPLHMHINQKKFDTFLVLYGWQAQLPELPLVLQPQCNSKGFVEVNDHCQTSIADMYAIGEITQRVHPCTITAMADGVIAAKAIQAQLENSI